MRIKTVRVPPKFGLDEQRIILGTTLTLDEWIRILRSNRAVVSPNNCFPTDEMRQEFLDRANDWSDDDVRTVLRNLLMKSGNYGTEPDSRRSMWRQVDELGIEKTMEREYYRRLLGGRAWEGITWVLDLLPDKPTDAVNVIDAYIHAHIQFFTDQQFDGLLDAMAVIRGRYMTSTYGPEAFHTLSGIEFEKCVGDLYREYGYEVSFTPQSHDGGIDVRVVSGKPGRRDHIFVQCKRTRHAVGVKDVRELRGVLGREDVPKGVLVTSGGFTNAARTFAHDDKRLELIDGHGLARMFSERFGRHWPVMIDRIRLRRQDYG